MGGHGYTLEAHVADSGPLGERTALRLLAALAAEAERVFRAGGLRDGLAAADVETDGEPETARVAETLAPEDPRRRAARAPEAGEAETERGVVFSLGLIAFHAIAGAPALRGSSDAAAPVHELHARRVSEPTVDLIRRATARDPRSRPDRLRDLRRAAERILAGTRWEGDRPVLRARRSPIALPAIALLAVSVTAALFHFRVGPFRAERLAASVSRLFSSEDDAPRGDGELAIERIAAARSRVEAAERATGTARLEALREASAALEEARALLERHAASHPEARAEVEARLAEIESELAACRRLSSPSSD